MAAATTRLALRVLPGAGRTEVVGRYGDAWKVRVSAAPERGRANGALLDLLSKQLGVKQSDVAIVSGHTTRNKIVELRGISSADVAARMER
jgi:uncharacterized protein